MMNYGLRGRGIIVSGRVVVVVVRAVWQRGEAECSIAYFETPMDKKVPRRLRVKLQSGHEELVTLMRPDR